MAHVRALSASLVVAMVTLYACSDSDTPSTPAADAGRDVTQSDGGGGADGGGGTDTGAGDSATADSNTPGPVRCTQAEFDAPAGANGGDFTTFPGVDISFPTSAVPAQYTNRCAKVKVGSDVTFAGSFSFHPLQPSGGDTPTPIPSVSADADGGAITIKVNAAGTFGYECQVHPATMFGAIQVVP